MISRRNVLAGLVAATAPAITGCASRHTAQASAAAQVAGGPSAAGLDAVIDISHNVTVTDFAAVRRRSHILAVVHKATEGGDWIDPSYGVRRPQAESAGLLWGAYHFGTRQYSGQRQAQTFLAAAQPGPKTVMALDFEPNDHNPRNTMTLAQAEAFVQTVYQATGRLPVVYTQPNWANGMKVNRGLSLGAPIPPTSILARCDLWLADYRESPEVPLAWANRGWRLWQYAGDETELDAAYGSVPRTVSGVSHCDRNVFAGDTSALYKFWNAHA
ncbi:MAG: glycoside hydrolase family 25 protein [Proteobacteria bacterium]|nr:glycoside hydrolase family 25 protein [Pseudomonadota bacterium]